MASEEYEDCFEYDDSLGIPEFLLDKLYDESLLDEDGDYDMEMLQNVTETESEEGNSPWEEMASEYFACFLKEFPAQKEEIEKCIRCLREMANNIDETHKNCTIASIAANSTSASSGLLTILGLTLAPVTAGGSLILTATGIGLGAAATVTGLSASLYESVNNSKERKKAQELMNECEKSLRKAMCPDEIDFVSESAPNNGAMGENVKHLVSNVACQVPDMYKAVKGIKTNVKALKIARANPGLKALAKRATAAGSTSRGLRGVKHVKKAFAGTTLAMSKGARLLSATSAGLFLLFDAYGIVQDAKHLAEGAKAETAMEIREKASKLEEKVQTLNRLYKELNKKLA
ncbi:apolipoprotein L2-like [Elgaria multicarinata webbii]|uniref:apolipoprotein L2-like n=1 Tax=Elgaria multicarinata webbii TaxID=159646 RepID=UPI002FCD27BC